MAHSHTKDQRKFILTLLAYGYPPEIICAKFRVKWRDTACVADDVHTCDPLIVALNFDEHTIYKAAHKFAEENPELIAPRLNPIKRQIALEIMGTDCYERRAYDQAAKYFEQLAKEQAGAYAPKPTPGKVGGADGEKAEPIAAIVRKVIDPKLPEPVAEPSA
jgi:hypothetical protein